MTEIIFTFVKKSSAVAIPTDKAQITKANNLKHFFKITTELEGLGTILG